jgi:hypothetical protein
MNIEEKIAKLPKWAQEHITSLTTSKERADLALQRRLDELSGEEKSNVILLSTNREKDIPLPNHSIIRFVIGDDKGNKSNVDCHVNKKELRVYITTQGAMLIKPQANNSAYITTEELIK